jgi:hypothetical protein
MEAAALEVQDCSILQEERVAEDGRFHQVVGYQELRCDMHLAEGAPKLLDSSDDPANSGYGGVHSCHMCWCDFLVCYCLCSYKVVRGPRVDEGHDFLAPDLNGDAREVRISVAGGVYCDGPAVSRLELRANAAPRPFPAASRSRSSSGQSLWKWKWQYLQRGSA